MQLSAITNEQDVHAAQEQLQGRIRGEGGPLRRYRIGNRRGQGEAEVCYVERVGLWHAAERLDNRWSNGFGLEDPTTVPMLTVVTWINPAFDGSRRTGAGAFFRDADGHTWLAHSGRIGGGKKGIGRTAFLDGFSGAVQTVEGNDYIIIGRISASEFLDELAAFVRAVQAFKIGVGGLEDQGEDEDDVDRDEASDRPADDPDDYGTLDAFVTTGDETVRRMVLEWVATMIRHVHAQNPACWAVTGRRGPRLRLLVGNTVAVELSRGRVGVGLHPAGVPADAVADGGIPDFPYARMDGCLTRWFSLTSFVRHHEGLRPSALRFIEQVAAGYRRTPAARFHAPEFLDAIARELATTLPKPSYTETATITADLPEPSPAAEPEEKLDFGGIMDRIISAGLRFPDDLVSSYLLALQAKRFVILSGISGTGKTQLALTIARLFQPLGATAVIAVRPDWTDNRGLLGYHNPITNSYQTTPFLRLLLAAADEEARAAREGRLRLPFFIVLDEMNLARVEHYFSDFLSCLESGEPLHLHDEPLIAAGTSETSEVVPMQLPIPRNLFFTGTVNVDETTYMFSPKVLDRAFVLEFNDVDLGSLGAEPSDDAGGEASVLQLRHFVGALDIRDKPSPADYARFRELDGGALHRALASLNERLQVEHRHFGYRVANEIARFVGLAVAQAGKEPAILWDAFDVAVVAKVLPKLHGTQQELEDVLGQLLAFAVDVESSLEAREHESHWSYLRGRLSPRGDGPPKIPRLPRAAAKLWRMLHRVRQQGYVSFIE